MPIAQHAASRPVLEVQHIEKIYGTRSNVTHALADVSFTVNAGDGIVLYVVQVYNERGKYIPK